MDLLSKPELLECTDTANLPKDHLYYVGERKKIPGLLDHETDGQTITEFCALRTKSYAYKIDEVPFPSNQFSIFLIARPRRHRLVKGLTVSASESTITSVPVVRSYISLLEFITTLRRIITSTLGTKMKVYLLIFSICHFSVLASGDIFGIWNTVNSAANDFGNTVNNGVSDFGNTVSNTAKDFGNTVNNAAKDFGNTVNKGINTVSIGISKIPDAVNNGAKDFGNTVNNGVIDLGNTMNNAAKDFGNTVNNRVNAVDIEISKFHGTVYSAIDAAGNTVNSVAKDFGNTVNNGVNAVGNGISEVPRLVNGVVCSDVLTGVLINFLIACNPHAFITDTLDTEDAVMMESCKYVEVASFALPVLADLATAPVQIVCSVWAEERLELYSHLKGIEVNKLFPALSMLPNTVAVDNNKLLYELAKMNDQYCNGDCNVNDYEFVEPPPSSGNDNGRFKRSISSKVFKKVAELISKKSEVKMVRIVVKKNGVTTSLTFRGLKGTASIRGASEFTAGLLNIHRQKSLGFHQNVNSLIDLYTKYKIIPNTLTTKYIKHPPTSTDFMKNAWENWYREFLLRENGNIPNNYLKRLVF
ncbi:Hypothetical protein CINCED_3A014055 [Cinara cedri]|uniref:Uncharacterized protein n=1 Tax=Cinara cedri TaxID=506608 RepID=A0A5E4NT38_9HEMI|nr:Hypothetical protein CINCED_3A014055 [Cinara cedri]